MISKKITILLLLLVITLVILHFSFGLFTRYNFFSAKFDVFNNRPCLLEYGAPELADKYKRKVAKKMGFTLRLLNCTISWPEKNGLNSYNKVTNDYLKIKLGNDWKTRFNYSVDSLFRIDRKDTIRKIIMQIPEIKRTDSYLDSVSNGKRHIFVWILNKEVNNSNVRVGEKVSDDRINVFWYYNVDPYTLHIERIQY